MKHNVVAREWRNLESPGFWWSWVWFIKDQETRRDLWALPVQLATLYKHLTLLTICHFSFISIQCYPYGACSLAWWYPKGNCWKAQLQPQGQGFKTGLRFQALEGFSLVVPWLLSSTPGEGHSWWQSEPKQGLHPHFLTGLYISQACFQGQHKIPGIPLSCGWTVLLKW